MMDRGRVLVVDDDHLILRIVQDALEAAGYYVAILDRSTDVPASIIAQQPDLLILDVMMPDKDAPQVLGEMTVLLVHPPVLLMTALPLTEECYAGYPVVNKPFDPDVLVARVDAMVPAPHGLNA